MLPEAVAALLGAVQFNCALVVLFPVMVLGAWIGGRLFHGLASESLYRNVALAILFATGVFGLSRNFLLG
mgnify:CR=1 FL=1